MTGSPFKGSVVITGAASGIGEATANRYLKLGYTVFGLDQSFQSITDFNYHHIRCDISNEHEVQQAFLQIRQQNKIIDYLVCCAGVFFASSRSELSMLNMKEWNEVLSVNLTGSMLATRECIDLMRGEGDKAIIFVSSDQVAFPRKKNVAYASSKGALEAFCRGCASELLDRGIRSNAVAPASVRTHFIDRLTKDGESVDEIYHKENLRMPLGLIEPDDVADAIVFLGSIQAKKNHRANSGD